MKSITRKRRFLVLLGLSGLLAAACATGCSDKTYAGGDSAPSGKAPAASAPPAATPDASRAKPGSDDAGGK